jgi:DNA helicase-2/ATP-dependent DNA helicase PcrA
MKSIRSLNEEQQQASQHGEGPLLIIAGAGTGKTTVITQRIKYLILEKKVAPSEILALTFTEKAAREMEERVDVALPYGYTQLWIETFHAFCDRILRSDAIHIGLNPSYKLTTEAESILFLRKNLFKLKLNYFQPLSNPYKFLQGFISHINRLKDDDITPDDYAAFAQKLKHNENVEPDEIKKTLELSRGYKIYEDLKTSEGIMDFGDLISNVLKLFRTRKNVLAQYQNSFKYILIDEFQDTNFAQNEMAILLAGERKNITVVGDDDQSVYRWRGAAISNILQFKKHFPKAKVVTLTKNYRSTQEILDRAYQMIQFNNPDRLEVKEKVDKKLIAERTDTGAPVEFICSNRVENEAEFVAKKIKGLVHDKKYDYRDFAILVRANDHAQPFVRALERARVPVQFLGPGRLFQQPEIKDLIAYLKILYNFEDNASVYRLLTMPFWGFEARDIAAILNFAKRKNYLLFEALENIDELGLLEEVTLKIKNIVEMIHNHLKKVPRESAGQILYYFLEDSGLFREYLSAEKPEEEKRVQNIAKLFQKLKKFESEHTDASIFAVVDWIDLSMELGESPMAADVDWSENNAVNIMTVHSSKGLEFPVVFIVSLVSQRFPTRDRKEQIPVPESLIKEVLPEGDYNLQEERRLFYVAMTRAKDKLFLTASLFYGEGRRERKISPFVIEALGDAAVKKILDRQKSEMYVQQLSLLDIMQPEKQAPEIIQKPNAAQKLSFISYSQIQAFDMCPMHYKMRYILKLPSQPVAALSFGISMHNVLKDYYQALINKETMNQSVLENILKNRWIREGYQSKMHEETAFVHAKEILENYVKENANQTRLPVALELPFQYSISNLKVLGRIDRIDMTEDGKIEIIDYKTGENLPDEKKLKTNLQLTMYALAASKINDSVLKQHAPEDVLLSLYYLEGGVRMTTTRTKEQLEEAEDLILKKVEEIENSSFECRGGIFCKTCEYKMVCKVI